MIKFPQSSFFEFYCPQNRLGLAEYRKEKADAMSENDKAAFDQLAAYYDDITYDIVNQVLIVEKDGKLNFIYETELAFAPAIYDYCHLYPGFAVVRKGNRAGNLFFHEGLSEPASYRDVDVFEVKRNGYYGVEKATGEILLDCTLHFVKVYPECILALSDEGYALFHPDGKKMFDNEYFDEVDLSTMLGNYIFVQKDKQWGVVDVTGYWIVPAIFHNRDDIEWWGYGYFYCSLNGKKGLYDTQGKLIVPYEYDKIEIGKDWRPHPFIVTLNDKCGLIDCKGNVVFPCVYDEITCMGYCYRVWKDGTDTLWHISETFDFSKLMSLRESDTSCRKIESSCCDFYEMYRSCFSDMEDEYACEEDGEGNPRTYKLNDKEALRWFLMSSVFSNSGHWKYKMKYWSKKLKDLSIQENNEILALFEYQGVRMDKKVIKS